MYHLTKNFSLRGSNTFGLSAFAKYYLTVNSAEDLIQFFNEANFPEQEKILLLGEGSNLLFINDFNGLIIHPEIDGIRLINENKYIVEEIGRAHV